jgi:hypothetical protein
MPDCPLPHRFAHNIISICCGLPYHVTHRSVLYHIRAVEARLLPPPIPRRSQYTFICCGLPYHATHCSVLYHVRAVEARLLPPPIPPLTIYIHMLWPVLSCNLLLRNISYTAGCRGQTTPDCTTLLTIYIHKQYKPAPSCYNTSYTVGCRGHRAPSCTTLLTICMHILWPAISCNSVRQCAWQSYDSARGSVRLCGKAAVCGSAAVCTAARQCARSVWQCAAVCGSVRQGAAVRGRTRGCVRQCGSMR